MISLNDVLLAMSNIPVDDPIAEIWGRQMQGGYKIIEYTGSLPITINANGEALIDYRVYGASGGVGEQTENLIDASLSEQTIEIKPSTWYSISRYDNNFNARNLIFGIYDENDNLLWSDYLGTWHGESIVLDNAKYFKIKIPSACLNAVSLVEGKRPAELTIQDPYPTSYIPYGYRLPMVTSDGNTDTDTPVYIGENQLDSVEGVSDYVDKSSGKIVRMIGEYTFTGDESFNKYGNSDVFYTSTTIDPVGITTVNTITMRCDHPAFTAIENKDTRYWLNPGADDICCFLPGGRSQVFLRSTSNFTTATECKAYLKTQYDNGTPVKISYWLKTPIEEDPPVPLPEIPTIDGETAIDYDGEPKPSQMYVKYKGKSGGA